jgi:HK97 family phage major capsid protein
MTNLPEMPNDGKKRFVIAASSEFPVERMNWFGDRWREVLDHSAESIQMTRFTSGRGAVLEEHGGAPVGVIDGAAVGSDRVMRVIARFSQSQRGQDIQRDVEDSIRPNSSIGYLPKRAVLVEENSDLGDLWRVTQWEPVELSVVGVPADPTVGVGRNMADAVRHAYSLLPNKAGGTPEEAVTMKKVRGDNGQVIEVPEDDPRPAITAEPVVARSVEVVRAAAPAVEGLTREQTVEVIDIAEAHGMQDRLRDWLARGLSPDQAAREVVNAKRTKGGVQPAAEHLELNEKDRSRYSYRRAILQAAEGNLDGLEAEVSQELALTLPQKAERHGGFYVPLQLGGASIQPVKRTLASNIGTGGTELVYEQPGELIELLRNRTVVIQMGARTLTGLTAPIAFPKQTAAMTAVWVGENPGADVAASDIVLGLALLSPKTLQASGAYSRQLLALSTLDVEMMVRDELALIHAIALDKAAIHGAGAGEPVGVYKAIGASTADFGSVQATYAKFVLMIQKVANLNADLGTLGFVTHTTVAANAMTQLTFGNVAASTPIWNGTVRDAIVAGYRAMATNQISTTMSGTDRSGGTNLGVAFGNWNDLIIGSWGGLELVVDPYRLKKQGVIEVTSFQMCDTLCRHGESFAVAINCVG